MLASSFAQDVDGGAPAPAGAVDLPQPLVLYNLMGVQGDTVANSAAGEPPLPLDLQLVTPVQRKPDGLWLTGTTPILRTPEAATALSEALSGGVELQALQVHELTVEAVVTPANAEQEGPARIVTLSADPHLRNFTLGQYRDMYIFRLRTTQSDENGTPEIQSRPGVVQPRAQHVVATFADGMVRLYVDGDLVGEAARPGNFANWDLDFPLALGNEITGDRPWQGGLHLAAIYATAMTPEQVQARYAQLVATL